MRFARARGYPCSRLEPVHSGGPRLRSWLRRRRLVPAGAGRVRTVWTTSMCRGMWRVGSPSSCRSWFGLRCSECGTFGERMVVITDCLPYASRITKRLHKDSHGQGGLSGGPRSPPPGRRPGHYRADDGPRSGGAGYPDRPGRCGAAEWTADRPRAWPRAVQRRRGGPGGLWRLPQLGGTEDDRARGRVWEFLAAPGGPPGGGLRVFAQQVTLRRGFPPDKQAWINPAVDRPFSEKNQPARQPARRASGERGGVLWYFWRGAGRAADVGGAATAARAPQHAPGGHFVSGRRGRPGPPMIRYVMFIQVGPAQITGRCMARGLRTDLRPRSRQRLTGT